MAPASEEVVAALWAVGTEGATKIVVPGATVGHVVILTWRGRQLFFAEVADRIAFEEEGPCFLLGSHEKSEN